MSEEEEVEFDDIEEKEDYTEMNEIKTEALDRKVYDIKHDYIDGKIILQPDFQRQYVWNDKAGTLFVDSLIRGVPIPNIFCAENEDGQWEVIDGQQRLTTVLSFILNQKLKNEGEFIKTTSVSDSFVKLSKSDEFNAKIRGKTFEQLPKEYQQKIENTTLRIVVLKNLKNNENIKYDMFRRLNTGANKLNDMELRKCIYRSKYFDKLEELAKTEKFRSLIGLNCRSNQDLKRMKDVNIVLQFAGMKDDITNYAGSYQRWLNALLATEQKKCKRNDFSGVKKLKQGFENAVAGLYVVFGDEPIRRYVKAETLIMENGGKTPSKSVFEKCSEDVYILRKINIALINALMVGFSKYKPIEIQRKADVIKRAIICIQLNDDEFTRSIGSQQTADKRKVSTRINKVKALLKNILENPDDKRFFPTELKHELFEESRKKHDGEAYCAICHGVIHKESDASVDHIKPYSKGGETTKENAQLVHIWCNSSKGNREE